MKFNEFGKKHYLCFFEIIICFCITNFLSCNSSTPSNMQRERNNLRSNMEEQSLIDVNPDKINVSDDKHNMLTIIKTLCETSREIGSQNERDACIYLKKQLEIYGYEPYIQTFNYKIHKGGLRKETFFDVDVPENEKDGKSQNIVVIKKTNSNIQNDTIIITAHYDCIKNSRGANDNAAGVAVLMDVARRLKNWENNDLEIRFILFGGEENMIFGSRYYVSKLTKEETKNIKAVINLDTFAQKGNNDTVFYTIRGKDNAASLLLKSISSYNDIKTTSGPLSDYFTFYAMNIPAVNIGQELEGLKFNSPDDTIDLINEKKLEEISNLLINVIKSYR